MASERFRGPGDGGGSRARSGWAMVGARRGRDGRRRGEEKDEVAMSGGRRWRRGWHRRI
jgi:hypothetical protein